MPGKESQKTDKKSKKKVPVTGDGAPSADIVKVSVDQVNVVWPWKNLKVPHHLLSGNPASSYSSAVVVAESGSGKGQVGGLASLDKEDGKTLQAGLTILSCISGVSLAANVTNFKYAVPGTLTDCKDWIKALDIDDSQIKWLDVGGPTDPHGPEQTATTDVFLGYDSVACHMVMAVEPPALRGALREGKNLERTLLCEAQGAVQAVFFDVVDIESTPRIARMHFAVKEVTPLDQHGIVYHGRQWYIVSCTPWAIKSGKYTM